MRPSGGFGEASGQADGMVRQIEKSEPATPPVSALAQQAHCGVGEFDTANSNPPVDGRVMREMRRTASPRLVSAMPNPWFSPCGIASGPRCSWFGWRSPDPPPRAAGASARLRRPCRESHTALRASLLEASYRTRPLASTYLSTGLHRRHAQAGRDQQRLRKRQTSFRLRIFRYGSGESGEPVCL